MIFMADVLVIRHPAGGVVDLTRVAHATPMPRALREDAVIVTVTRDGNIFLGTGQVRLRDLSYEIRTRMNEAVESKVYIKADARSKYADVAAVLEAVRLAQVQDIALLTESSSH